MVRAADLSEMEADGVLDAGEQGREVGLQTIERDGDRSMSIGGDHGTTSGETAPSGRSCQGTQPPPHRAEAKTVRVTRRGITPDANAPTDPQRKSPPHRHGRWRPVGRRGSQIPRRSGRDHDGECVGADGDVVVPGWARGQESLRCENRGYSRSLYRLVNSNSFDGSERRAAPRGREPW